VERVVENLGTALQGRGHDVRVVAQCVDELHFGRMTHVIRERQRFAPFVHRGMAVEQFRPSRRRRALLLPLAWELIPLGGRISRRWVGWYSAGYYARMVRGVLAPLLADADVVHVLGSNFMSVAAVEAAHALSRAVAVSPFAHLGEWGDDSVSVRAYTHADAVIATTAADAAVYGALGVPQDRLHVAGLPVPAAELGAGAPAGLADPDAGPLVLYLGQRRPTKRLELLLAATRHVWERVPDARFAFVGPGLPLEARDPRILDIGRVSDLERGRWFARADVLCLPSSSESFGMVVAEAWSARLPVVTSDIPVLRELVDESGGGLYAPPDPPALAEAISSLLLEPERARALGEAGHSYWKGKLTPDAVAGRHLEVYERIAAARRTAHPPPRVPEALT
jgi:glycosyltransferase involved in cell wall biosynthesis